VQRRLSAVHSVSRCERCQLPTLKHRSFTAHCEGNREILATRIRPVPIITTGGLRWLGAPASPARNDRRTGRSVLQQPMTLPADQAHHAPGHSASEAARRLPRWFVVLAVVSAIGIAGFAGFRVPSTWCATHDAVSLFDGFHRRFFVGTLLRPLAVASGYNYWVFAVFSYLVLAAVLVVLTVAAARAELLTRRVLIIAWLLLPTGGFLFDEVGYFDQLLYLLLFAAIWLVSKGRLVAATSVMCIAPFIHEICLLTVIPVFGLVALRTLPPGRALAVAIPPVLLDLVVLVIPPAAPGAVARLSATLTHANFTANYQVLALFERTQGESWRLYNVYSKFVYVRTFALVLVVAFAAIWLTDRRLWRRVPGPIPVMILCASCLAIAAPALLSLAGWDGNRWAFLTISNFVLVLWISLGERRSVELGAVPIVVLVMSLLIVTHFSIVYFNGPRDLGSSKARREFLHQIADGSMFTIPD
jgi:hypothetical protein